MMILIMLILILYRSSDDLCYISHCYPYPYSQLYQWLLQLEQDDRRWCNVTKQVICKNLAGNDVFLQLLREMLVKRNCSRGKE